MMVTVPADRLQEVMQGVEELADARHDLDTYVLIRRMREAVAEWFYPWDERAVELIVRHTGGPLTIGPDHAAHPAFIADPEVQEHWGREIILEAEPVSMADLAKASGLKVSRALDALREVGLVIDEAPSKESEQSTPKNRSKS